MGTYFALLCKTGICLSCTPFIGQEQAESGVPNVSGVFWGFPGWSWVPGSSCWFICAAIHSPSADWLGSWRWCHKCKQMKIYLTSNNLSLMIQFQKECVTFLGLYMLFSWCLVLMYLVWRQKGSSPYLQIASLSTQGDVSSSCN